MSNAKKLQDAILAQEQSLSNHNEIKATDWLSSGSTLVNLGCSGTIHGALAKGKFFWFVGESSSGKTSLMLTALAEACLNPNFDQYDLEFDNAEDGALMNIEGFYGSRLAQRLRAPNYHPNGSPKFSRTVDDLYLDLFDKCNQIRKGKRRPFIRLVDSMDALSSSQEQGKINDKINAWKKDKDLPGEMTDGKAKQNSANLRNVVQELRDTGSILIIISQLRDNMGGGMFDPADTVAGGRSLKFYATWQLWAKPGQSLIRTVNGNKRKIGMTSRIDLRKNRMTGKDWSIEVPICFSVGVDDLGSMVDYLVNEDALKKSDKGIITAPDFNFEGTREELIQHIDQSNLTKHLQLTTLDTWKSVEEACRVVRTSRYT